MCGIVGLAGDIEFADRAIFRDMLDICQLRGRDSTGAININRQMSYGYIKEVGPPTFLFDRKSYSQIIETGTHAAFIGHCRHKTQGEVSRKNAHPFDFEDEGIIGVHNGTLRNYHHLDGHAFGKVDSEVLYGHLAKNGPENTFDRIEGAWACVWWDDQEETLNFIRNEERPMVFCWSEDRRKLYWASSVWMLQAIQAEKRVKMWKGPKDDYEGKYIELPVDTLWSFSLHPNAKKGDPTLTMKPAKKIERKKPVVVERTPWKQQGGNGSLASWAGGSKEETAQEVWNKKTNKTHKWDPKISQFVELMPFAEWEKKFEELKKESGGSVPNPFQAIDDQLPVHLRPRPETLALIQGGKSSTTDSTQPSSETSKNGAEQEQPLNSTTSGEKSTTSPVRQNSTRLQKTDKSGSSALLKSLHARNGGSTPNKVSFRSIHGMAFITDEVSGVEYSEAQVQENTEGFCSFCDQPIGDLTEIYEFFGRNKFICVHCTEPSVRSSAA